MFQPHGTLIITFFWGSVYIYRDYMKVDSGQFTSTEITCRWIQGSLHLQRLHGGGFRRDLKNVILFSALLEIFSSMTECAALRLQLLLSKTNKKQTRVHLFNERVIAHCLIMAQRQRLVNIPSKTAP